MACTLEAITRGRIRTRSRTGPGSRKGGRRRRTPDARPDPEPALDGLPGDRPDTSDAAAGDALRSRELPGEGNLTRGPPAVWRERSASRIALLLVGIFGVFLLAVSLGGLLFLASFAEAPGPAATEALIPFLEAVGDMSLKLFGPVLAFVLGYYFGKERRSA